MIVSGPFSFLNSKFNIDGLILENNCGIICGLLLDGSSSVNLTNLEVDFYKILIFYLLIQSIIILIIHYHLDNLLLFFQVASFIYILELLKI